MVRWPRLSPGHRSGQVRMLVQLTEELERRGVKLVIARDIGQVRDVLETASDTVKARAYPTVQAAVDDLQR